MDIGPVQRIVDIEPTVLPLPEVLPDPTIGIDLTALATVAERGVDPVPT